MVDPGGLVVAFTGVDMAVIGFLMYRYAGEMEPAPFEGTIYEHASRGLGKKPTVSRASYWAWPDWQRLLPPCYLGRCRASTSSWPEHCSPQRYTLLFSEGRPKSTCWKSPPPR